MPAPHDLTPDDLLAHTRWARRLARSLLGDASAAEDVVQEAWQVALDGQPPTDRPLRAWLAGVLRHRALHWRRSEGSRRRREHGVAREEALPGEHELVERAETSRGLMKELLALDEPYRSTLLLRYFEEHTPSEIARRRGVAPGTVRSQLARGLAQLRERLDRANDGDRKSWCIALLPVAGRGLAPASLPLAPTLAQGALTMSAVKLGAGAVGVVLIGALLLTPRFRGYAPSATLPEPAGAAIAPEVAADEIGSSVADLEVGATSRREALDARAGGGRDAGGVDATAPTVRGRLVDASGTPIAGARVLAARREEWIVAALDAVRYDGEQPGEYQRFESATDEQGRFVLSGPQPGALRLAARAEGFTPFDDDERYLSVDGLDVGDVALSAGVLLAGRVVDADGAAVAGATIRRYSEPRNFALPVGLEARLAETAPDGSFRATLAPGKWTLEVLAADYPLRRVSGASLDPGEHELVIELQRSFAISGRVVPARDRTVDLSKLRVTWSLDDGQDKPPELLREHRFSHVQCGADGSFEIRGLRSVEGDPPTRYKLFVNRVYAGHRRALSDYATANAGATGVEIELRPYAEIRFELVDAETEEAIASPDVYLLVEGFNQLSVNESETLRSEGNGRFAVTEVAPLPGSDALSLRIQKQGYLDRIVARIPLDNGGVAELGRVALTPAPIATVNVVDARDGSPVSGAQVTSFRELAPYLSDAVDETTRRIDFLPRQLADTTGEDGVARLRAAIGEETVLRIAHEEFAHHPPVTLVPRRGEPIEVTVELEQGGSVDVVVTDAAGAPAVGQVVIHEVQLPGSPGPRGGRVSSDTSGTARFQHLPPARHRFRLSDAPIAEGGKWHEVDLIPGGHTVVELVAPLEATLEARVTEAGVALAGAEVFVAPAGTRLEMYTDGRLRDEPAAIITDSEGGFRVEGLETGDWIVSIGHAQRTLQERVQVRVERGARRVEIDLPLSEVEGRVALAGGEGLAGAAVWAFRASDASTAAFRIPNGWVPQPADLQRNGFARTSTDAQGRYVLRGVPADTELVVAALGGGAQYTPSEPFVVAPGERRTGVDLLPQPAGSLVVEIERADTSIPARFYRVTAEPTDREYVSFVAYPDDEGTARFDDLAPGVWRVTVTSGSGRETRAEPTSVTVEAGAEARLTVEL